MRTLYLIVILFGIFQIGNSQSYVPFPTKHMRWKGFETNHEGYWRKYEIIVDSDTVISGKVYHKLMERSLIYPWEWGGIFNSTPYFVQEQIGYFRNDSTERKVYLRMNDWNDDRVWYDFSLNIGDTLKHPIYNNFRTVKSIDTIDIDGIPRKRLLLDSCIEWQDVYLYHIEGIGSNFGPLGSFYCPFESSESLNCVVQNGNVIYSVITCDTNCAVINSVKRLDVSSEKLGISPNPAQETIRIQFLDPNIRDAQELKIYSITGQLVLHQMIYPPESEINIETLESGVYMYVIGDQRGKMVVE
ncbi:T9SS type A sorting domain-containing protein [bacterium SCSIO 12643]|nr:T9SS type A sorting domain-containing protein [bacterium SCSIO 12643]